MVHFSLSTLDALFSFSDCFLLVAYQFFLTKRSSGTWLVTATPNLNSLASCNSEWCTGCLPEVSTWVVLIRRVVLLSSPLSFETPTGSVWQSLPPTRLFCSFFLRAKLAKDRVSLRKFQLKVSNSRCYFVTLVLQSLFGKVFETLFVPRLGCKSFGAEILANSLHSRCVFGTLFVLRLDGKGLGAEIFAKHGRHAAFYTPSGWPKTMVNCPNSRFDFETLFLPRLGCESLGGEILARHGHRAAFWSQRGGAKNDGKLHEFAVCCWNLLLPRVVREYIGRRNSGKA